MCAKTIGKIGIMKFEIIEHNDNISLVELKNNQAGLYIVQVVCVDGTIEKSNMIIIK
jgi:hypothetical protein